MHTFLTNKRIAMVDGGTVRTDSISALKWCVNHQNPPISHKVVPVECRIACEFWLTSYTDVALYGVGDSEAKKNTAISRFRGCRRRTGISGQAPAGT